MMNNVFISFSAVQIYDISYIHLHYPFNLAIIVLVTVPLTDLTDTVCGLEAGVGSLLAKKVKLN